MSSIVRASRFWDVKFPPPKKHMVGGSLVPTVRGAFGGHMMQKSRRVVIEIYGPERAPETRKKGTSDEGGETTDREVTPLLEITQNEEEDLRGDDQILVRVLKRVKKWGRRDDDDEDEESGDEDEDANTMTNEERKEDWTEEKRFDLDEIKVIEVTKNTFEAQLGKGHGTEVRQIRFANDGDVALFAGALEKLREMESKRAEQQLQSFRRFQLQKQQRGGADDEAASAVGGGEGGDGGGGGGGSGGMIRADDDEDIRLLVEVVSASDLPVADSNSTDPYVIVHFGNKEIHRTKTLMKTTDPIWTVDTGSLFIVTSRPDEFFKSSSGLKLIVRDYDRIGKNETIGTVILSQDELLASEGERKEYQLMQDSNSPHKRRAFAWLKPTLNVRIRRATRGDYVFIQQLAEVRKSKKGGIFADTSFVAPTARRVKLIERETKRSEQGLLYRVKPGPEPGRDEETRWMTEEQIDAESLKPGKSWIEAGSGNLARIFFEIIGCDGLPNKDQGVGGKTDAFACVIYEDCIVNTDVVNDCLSPRFMPWSRRSFIFRMAHPSSQILLGVFDYDSENAMTSHDPIGRVTVDITNFHPGTEYTLQYLLFKSTHDDDRKPAGKVTIRLRIEWKDYRKAMFASLSAPPANYVNVTKKNDFKSAHFVCNGDENVKDFSMSLLKSYVSELKGLSGVSFYIQEALTTVLLWRGHYPVTFRVPWLAGEQPEETGFLDRISKVVTIKLPIHSMIAFLGGVLVIENFDLIPSFSLFGVAWLLLSCMEEHTHHPSPWDRCRTFSGLWLSFLAGMSFPKRIASNENEKAIMAYHAARSERLRIAAEEAEAAKQRSERLNSFLADEEAETAESAGTDIATSPGQKLSLNPLKPILMPVQLALGQVCVAVRILRSILIWDESYYAFLLTFGCLLGGLAVIWVPWGFLLRWLFRIIIWSVLGPWMKLVDIFYVKRIDEEKAKAKKEKREADLLTAKSAGIALTKRAKMMEREEALKLKALKRYMFGKYIASVPRFKEYRYRDLPLKVSKAVPYKPPEEEGDAASSRFVITARRHGQFLEGHMIPAWGDALDEDLTPLPSEEDKKTK